MVDNEGDVEMGDVKVVNGGGIIFDIFVFEF